MAGPAASAVRHVHTLVRSISQNLAPWRLQARMANRGQCGERDGLGVVQLYSCFPETSLQVCPQETGPFPHEA